MSGEDTLTRHKNVGRSRFRLLPALHRDNFGPKAQAKWFLLVGDLLKVGFSLQRALAFTMAVMKKERPVLTVVNQRLMAGESFADSVRPFVKTDLYYQLRLAEEHGELENTLGDVGRLLVAKQQQQQKLQRLLQYPLLLLFLLGMLIVGLGTYVFPELESWQVPGHTSLLSGLRVGLRIGGGLGTLLVFLLVIVTIIRWRRFSPDQRVSWLCGLPVIGKCYRSYYGYYVTSTVAILLQCGMSLKEILRVVNHFSPNSLLFCLGEAAQKQVSRGGDLNDLIEQQRFLPKELGILINKGTTVRELGTDLSMLAKMCFDRLLRQLEELLTFVQPIIFIVIAVVIVVLYLSILLPIYQSIQGVY